MERIQKLLGEILVEKGFATRKQVEEALKVQEATKEFLGAILLRRGYVKEEDLLKALSEKYGMRLVSLKDRYIDWAFVKKFSASLILDYKCFPFEKKDFAVTFAITNPLDIWITKKAEDESAGLRVEFVLVSSEDMEGAIQRYKQFTQKSVS